MLSTNDVAKVFDTLLSAPGMNETVKIDLQISRRNVLLLNQVIERGLTVEENEKESGLLAGISKENLEELRAIAGECLEKASLTEFSEKLNTLGSTK